MQSSIDRFGRVIIPKKIRDDLGLGPGALFDVAEEGGEIRLKPHAEGKPVARKNGVLVFTGEPTADITSVVRQDRDKRIQRLSRGLRK